MKTPKVKEKLRRKIFGTGNKRLKTMRKFLGPKALGVGVLAYAGSVVYKKKKKNKIKDKYYANGRKEKIPIH